LDINRICDFVETPAGDLYLQKPDTWLGGWARHLWFKRCIGKKANIASLELYENMSREHGVCQLVEYNSGLVQVLAPEAPE
jgi:hypothetical protein